MAVPLKMVRAKRTGFWDGHRRRAGAVFPVIATAKEDWFEDVGPAPEGTELPKQIVNVQAHAQKGFIELMKQQGNSEPSASPPVPQTLAEAQVQAPVFTDDLV